MRESIITVLGKWVHHRPWNCKHDVSNITGYLFFCLKITFSLIIDVINLNRVDDICRNFDRAVAEEEWPLTETQFQ